MYLIYCHIISSHTHRWILWNHPVQSGKCDLLQNRQEQNPTVPPTSCHLFPHHDSGERNSQRGLLLSGEKRGSIQLPNQGTGALGHPYSWKWRRSKSIIIHVWLKGVCYNDVTGGDNISKGLKMATMPLHYPSTWGMPDEQIETHSLHCGDMNALALSGYSDTQIQKRASTRRVQHSRSTLRKNARATPRDHRAWNKISNSAMSQAMPTIMSWGGAWRRITISTYWLLRARPRGLQMLPYLFHKKLRMTTGHHSLGQQRLHEQLTTNLSYACIRSPCHAHGHTTFHQGRPSVFEVESERCRVKEQKEEPRNCIFSSIW